MEFSSQIMLFISFQPDVVDLWYLKQWVLLDQIIKFEISKVYTIMLQIQKDLNI